MSRFVRRHAGLRSAVRPSSVRATAVIRHPEHAVRRAACAVVEGLEGRTLFSTAFALSGTNLLRFDTASPSAATSVAVTGIAAGETLVGIDFRPQNGFLYGLGVNATANNATLYAISVRTGVGGPVGTPSGIFFTTDGSTPVDLPDPATTGYGFDFNPAADRIRVVAGSVNFRVNPNSGAAIDGDNGAAPGSVSGRNPDAPANGATSTVDAAAYTNNQPNNGNVTTLYTLDASTDALYIQNPANGGTQTTVGATGVDFTGVNGFDIPAGVNAPSSGAPAAGFGFASLNVGGTTSLYSINLTTGASTLIGAIGSGAAAVQGLAVQSDLGGAPAIALSASGFSLLRFNTSTPGTVTTQALPGPLPGETLVGIDVRPQTGQLFGLGINATTNTGTLYLIDPQDGSMSSAGAGQITLTTDGSTVVDFPPTATSGYGFDFNPTVDRIRVTTSTGLNFRIDPNTYAPVNGGAAAIPDGNINGSGVTGAGANAYTNSYGQSLSGGVTTLYTLDAAGNQLLIQNPPNNGTQSNPLPVTLGGSPLDFTDVNGFDIPARVAVAASNAPAAGLGYAVLTVGGTTGLYQIDLATGAAALAGAVGAGATPLNGLALGDAPEPLVPPTAADLVVINTNDAGPGSLRNAIDAANFASGADTITFNIPGGGVHTITLASNLPNISDATTIDGYTQPGASANTLGVGAGSNAQIRVELNLNGHGELFVDLDGDESVIRGLSIGGGGGNGIHVDQSNEVFVTGNFIGVHADGVTAFPNAGSGVVVSGSTGQHIGGAAPADRNVISGNLQNGIAFEDGGSVIEGNLIGLDATGTLARGNGLAGVSVRGNFAGGSVIGGPTTASRNVISGNGDAGIFLGGNTASLAVAGVNVLNNYIGTDVTGTLDRGNDGLGIGTNDADGTVIGAAGAGNLIRFNDGAGISIRFSGLVTIVGNVVLDNSGGIGTFESDGLAIGGTAAGAGNVIGRNDGNGIFLGRSSDSARVQGNFIGTDSTGADMGNAGAGVYIAQELANALVGGPLPAAGNVIAFNGAAGVVIDDAFAGDPASDAEIRLNSIYSNDGLGIDLGDNGVTANDPGDGDGVSPNDQPNELQNFPVLGSAIVGGGLTTVQGSLNSNPNNNFLIDFYSNSAFDPSTFGEGRTYLGTVAVTTNGSGNATYSASFPVLPVGQFITATATRTSVPFTNLTSEFSQPVQVIAPPVPPTPPNPTIAVAADVSQNEGTGPNTTLTFTVTRTGDTTAASTVNFATADGTANNGSDYFGQSGTLNFAAGETSKTVNVTVVADASIESDEQFLLNLTGATGGTIGDNQAVATIVNDDFPPPSFSIGDVTLAEGSGAGTTAFTFTITRSGSSLASPSTVQVATANDSATAGSDYTAVPLTTVNFAANQVTATVTVNVTRDATFEPDETFFVNLSNPINGTIADGQGLGTIANDDASPPASVVLGTDANGKKALIINATEGNDRVFIDPGSKSSRYKVVINNVSYGEFDTGKFDRILMYLKGGDDFTGVATKITKDAFIFGGDGNDEIDGGSGKDVIVGGAGDDSLEGKKGRDVVIGGDGLDALFGDEDDDLLVAAATTYDADFKALFSLQKEWISSNSYSKRVSNIKSGSGSNLGGKRLDDSTVLDDGFADVLRGSASSDAFFVQTSATGGGIVKDTVVDKSSSETVTDVN